MATDATLSERASKNDVRDDLPTQARRGSGLPTMSTLGTRGFSPTDCEESTEYHCAYCGRALAALDDVCDCGNAVGVLDR